MSSALLEFWIWEFLGRLHPLVVHFPVALLVIAFAMEFFVSRAHIKELRNGIDILLKTGAISAIIAAIFGWLLQSQEDYGGNTLTIHMWSGVSTAILSVITAWLLHRALRNVDLAFRSYRIALAVTVIGVTIAGHFGASLTHGRDYLSSALPWNKTESNFDIATISNGKTVSEEQIAELNLEVRSIFAHNCYRCHSAQKMKSGLRLDSKEFVMKGGESGPVLKAGHPEKSEMIRRLLLSRDDEESMPPEGKTLTEREINTLQLWIKLGAQWPEGVQKSVYRVAALEPRNPTVPSDPGGLEHPIDRFVDAYFKEQKIDWPAAVDDRVFVRRVFLDIIGLLPPPERIEAFIRETHPDKRTQLVDELLARNDDYAQHWLTFWNDALRNDYTGTGYIDGGRSTITDWLYGSLQSNKPYDIFVKQLISLDKRSEGFIRGIKWRGTVNASQRVEMQAAQNISQVFLGLNLKCTSCHDSFISDWKLKDAYAFANIFSDTTLEINRCDKPTGKFAGTKFIFVELGAIDSTMTVQGKLKQLSTYLTSPKNGRLYRTIVNRIWAQMMGRGIVEPVDLMDNVPWSQDLLDWMASDLVAHGKDVKALIRKIATSRTYQMPSVAIKDENEVISSDYVFKGMHRRRLSAEQFTDAVSRIVYPVYPDSIKLFSPPMKPTQPQTPYARASLVKNDPWLTALGRPNRENVSTSRSTQANLLQALELTNGQVFNKALKAGAKQWKLKYSLSEEIVSEVYRHALGRPPEERELKAAVGMMGGEPSEESVEDLLWAVMLIPEFQLIY